MIVSLALHEAMHVFGAALVNVYAEYRSTNLTSVYPSFTTITPLQKLVFYGSGGWFTSIIWLLLSLRNKDSENVLICRYIALSDFVYGTFEALAPKAFWNMGAFVGMLVGFFSIFVVILWKKPEIIF
jgi:hypothetical protein